jgi:5-methylcytosine-specific restriction enzyme A
MGLSGDQTIDGNQNRRLAQSKTNGVEIHLFEVEKEKEYIYQGKVELIGEPIVDEQKDKDEIKRKVYVFPLKPIDGEQAVLNASEFIEIQKVREKKIKKLSIEELKEKALKSRGRVGERKVQSVQFERNPAVAQFTKQRAAGKCDLCDLPAPFNDKDGKPYLESHHIIWLARGGEDTIDNTVALCPNCHRRLHILDSEEDINKLKKRRQR